jgi:hypothetical protein
MGCWATSRGGTKRDYCRFLALGNDFGLAEKKLVKWAKAIRAMQVTVKMGNIKFEKCPLYP